MGKLTEDAEAAIKEAIRIVREDKSEAWWRNKVTPKADPPVDPKDPPKDPPVDPPDPKDPPTDPNDPPKDPPKKSVWWGEIYDDE
jgi:hypothetical protein